MSVTEEPRAKTSGDGREEQENVGRIEEIQGVVIEAVFPERLPEIYHAIRVRRVTEGVLGRAGVRVGYGKA